MIVNVCGNHTNGLGLQRDFEILRELLELRGHKVHPIKFDAKWPFPSADVCIWLEVLWPEAAFGFAKEHWLFPNPECWYNARIWDRQLARFSHVFCKTKDSLRIWRDKVGERAIFSGFTSRHMYDPCILQRPKFLHIAGNSQYRNTAAVLAAWRTFHLPYELIIVKHDTRDAIDANDSNIIRLGRVSDGDVRHLMNECRFHLIPSSYEGFCHALHEGFSCGAVVLALDAPPMNEFAGIDRELLIPRGKPFPVHLATAWTVTPDAIASTVRYAASTLSMERILQISDRARDAYFAERKAFRECMVRYV